MAKSGRAPWLVVEDYHHPPSLDDKYDHYLSSLNTLIVIDMVIHVWCTCIKHTCTLHVLYVSWFTCIVVTMCVDPVRGGKLMILELRSTLALVHVCTHACIYMYIHMYIHVHLHVISVWILNVFLMHFELHVRVYEYKSIRKVYTKVYVNVCVCMRKYM